MRVIFLALVVTAFIFLGGCVTYNKCVEKYGTMATDSPKVVARVPIDTTLTAIAEPDSVESSINLDTLCENWKAGKAMFEDSLKSVGARGKLETAFWIDKYNRSLRAKSKVKPDTIYVPYKDTAEAKVSCPPVVALNPDKNLPWWAPRMLWKQFQLFAAWVVLAGLALGVLRRGFKSPAA